LHIKANGRIISRYKVRYCLYLSSKLWTFALQCFICFIRPSVLSGPYSQFTVHCSLCLLVDFIVGPIPLNRKFTVHCSLAPLWRFIILVLVLTDKENVSLILSMQFIEKYILKQVLKLRARSLIPNQRYLTIQG